MKTGVILYVTGNQNLDFDEKSAIQGLNLDADEVQCVMSGDNNYDIMYAWWGLLRKGMRRVICMTGELNNEANIKLTGRNMQLCAYS